MKFYLYFLLFFTLFFSQVFSYEKENFIGRWQGVIEGGIGEGGNFFIFDLKKNNEAILIKQFSGRNLKEKAEWNIDNDNLILKFNDNSKIFNTTEVKFNISSNDKIININFNLILKKLNIPLSYIHLTLVLVGLILLNEIMRKYKVISIIFYFIIPIAFIPIWLNSGIAHWFRWVKLYSVVFASVWFILIRFTNLGKYTFAKFIAAAFLCVNIAEAVTQDFTVGLLPNVLNAIAGILNIITLSKWKGIGPDNSKEKDMIWPGMTVFWIIAYDIWNWTFVYLNFPEHAAYHIAVLLSCTIPSLFIKKGTWLQARAFTLAAWMMYLFTFTHFIDSTIVMLPRNFALMLIVALISIGSNIIYAILHFNYVFFKKAPKNLNVGQYDLPM